MEAAGCNDAAASAEDIARIAGAVGLDNIISGAERRDDGVGHYVAVSGDSV